MLGTAIFCGVMSLVEFITATSKYLGPSNTVLSDRYRQDAIMIATTLGTIFLALTIFIGLLYYTHIKHRVDLYEHGIVVVTWRGSISFTWHRIEDYQIEPIYGRSRRPVNWNVTLIRNDDTKAQFRGLEDLGALIRILERKIP